MDGLRCALRYFKHCILCLRYFPGAADVFGAALEPANGRVIVVRAGVAHAVLGNIGKIEIIDANIELQHPHARNPVPVAQCFDRGCNDPQVLGNDGQIA